MRSRLLLVATSALTVVAAVAHAQEAPAGAASVTAAPTASPATSAAVPSTGSGAASQATAQTGVALNEVVVTARRREERLKDIPVAVTAITEDTFKARQIEQVKDIAAYVPGLNINSDSVGRSFVTIRGVGTTFIDTVQPGVGIFIDGVYQPDTSYLNTPLVDVAQVEVLRGPQGTLFGNNTLAGAINIITKQPTNTFHARVDADYAGPDNFTDVSASVSGPIIKDMLQFRLGAGYHTQEGFERNTLVGGYQLPLDQSTVSGTLRFEPLPWAQFTLNGSYDRIHGASTAYFDVSGPKDYSLNGQTNLQSLQTNEYRNVDLKGDFDISQLHTKVTTIAAYNSRSVYSPGSDGDYSPVPFLQSAGHNFLDTTTGEVRFDTKWSDRISTLVGVFADRTSIRAQSFTTLVPLNLTVPSVGDTSNDTQAVYGTIFAKLTQTLEFDAGVRYDHQNLTSSTDATAGAYKSYQLDPRFALTEHWTPDIMTYASVSRGSRGGGQNGPGAPNLIFRGDNVWTYETGSKFSALNRKLSVDVDVFYNSYDHFIGSNALAPSTSGVGFVAVDLNAGRAYSYGFEGEATWALTQRWNLYGNVTAMKARIVSDDEFFGVTGYHLSSDRQLFTPDYNFSVGTNYRFTLGPNDALVADVNAIGKGSRVGASLNTDGAPVLSPYALANLSLTWQHGPFLLAGFVNNFTNTKYIESFIDKSVLLASGALPPATISDVAIQGDRRRYGVRASYKF